MSDAFPFDLEAELEAMAQDVEGELEPATRKSYEASISGPSRTSAASVIRTADHPESGKGPTLSAQPAPSAEVPVPRIMNRRLIPIVKASPKIEQEKAASVDTADDSGVAKCIPAGESVPTARSSCEHPPALEEPPAVPATDESRDTDHASNPSVGPPAPQNKRHLQVGNTSTTSRPVVLPVSDNRATAAPRSPQLRMTARRAIARIVPPQADPAEAGHEDAVVHPERPSVGQAPRTGRNAFTFFCKAWRDKLKAALPDASSREIQIELGVRYRAATKEELAPYEAQARQAQAAAASTGGATPARTVGKMKPRAKGESRTSGPRLKTAFQLFCDDLRPSITADNPRAGMGEIAALLAGAWRVASEEDKAIYAAQHKELRATLATLPSGPGMKEDAPKNVITDQDAQDAPSLKPRGRTPKKRRQTTEKENEGSQEEFPTVVQDDDEEEDDKARRECDWEKHPASFIISEDRSRDVYLVARRGLPLTRYGIVSASDTKQARQGGKPSPLPLELLDKYESFTKRFRTDIHRHQDDGELDLEDIPNGSSLEMCAILGVLRENGRELAVRGKHDIWMKVPLLATCRVVQWLLETARSSPEPVAVNAALSTFFGAKSQAPSAPDGDVRDADIDSIGATTAAQPTVVHQPMTKSIQSAAAAEAMATEP